MGMTVKGKGEGEDDEGEGDDDDDDDDGQGYGDGDDDGEGDNDNGTGSGNEGDDSSGSSSQGDGSSGSNTSGVSSTYTASSTAAQPVPTGPGSQPYKPLPGSDIIDSDQSPLGRQGEKCDCKEGENNNGRSSACKGSTSPETQATSSSDMSDHGGTDDGNDWWY